MRKLMLVGVPFVLVVGSHRQKALDGSVDTAVEAADSR